VWDTRTEGLFLPPGAGDDANTLRVLAAAYAQEIPIRVLKPTDKAALAKLKIPAGARTLLEAELAAGNAVILPEQAPVGAGQYGWLRVDPQDGLALGMMETGRGQDAVEYLFVLETTGVACAWQARMDTGRRLDFAQLHKCYIVGAASTLGIGAGLTLEYALAAFLGGQVAGMHDAPGPVRGR
jgi:hypothetical protein